MSARSTEHSTAHSPAPPAAKIAGIARIAAAPAAFTGAWALLRAAAALPTALAGDSATLTGTQETFLLLTLVTGATGAALLAAALLLARGSAGAWAAGVCLLFGLLALAVASSILLRRVDWIGAPAAAITLLVLLAPPVREAFLA